MPRSALLFFVKYPEPGRVKTRLAKTVGNEEAARRYRELAEANLKELRTLEKDGVDLWITFDPAEREAAVKEWLASFDFFLPQQGMDLGDRLQHAFRTAFDQGYEHVMAFGSDTLGCDAETVKKGFELLDQYDGVMGPARDGGYYLIGLNQDQPSIFREIPWSTPEVRQATLERIRVKNLRFYLLKKLDDLDEIQVESLKE